MGRRPWCGPSRRGVSFSLLTLTFTAIISSIVFRWTAVTGGDNGLRGLTRPPVLGVGIQDPLRFSCLTAVVVLAMAWAVWRVAHSPVGRVLVAIPENEGRCRSSFAAPRRGRARSRNAAG